MAQSVESNPISLSYLFNAGPLAEDSLEEIRSGDKRYFTSFFPAEKEAAAKDAKKEALAEAERQFPPYHPEFSREKFDDAYKRAYKSSYESHFKPLDLFYKSCRSFYIVAITDLLSRFQFDDDNIYELCNLLKPINARRKQPPSLAPLFRRYPVLNEATNLVSADADWRSHVALPLHIFGVKYVDELSKVPVEQYWQTVLNEKNLAGEQRYPHLAICIGLLMSLPFSNAPAERAFSKLDMTKTLRRNALHNKTTSSLMKLSYHLKNADCSSSRLSIPPSMIKAAQNVKANAVIAPKV